METHRLEKAPMPLKYAGIKRRFCGASVKALLLGKDLIAAK